METNNGLHPQLEADPQLGEDERGRKSRVRIEKVSRGEGVWGRQVVVERQELTVNN